MTGIIHSFESLAAVDGDGVRFAVFMAGCPLRCVYCHNPDTWQKNGKQFTAQQLVNKIARYKPYFKDNGGVTFSGGEPLVQAEFIKELVPLLKEQGIGYVIDTSGAVVLTPAVKYVLENAQCVILDLKFWDDASYNMYTGHGMKNTMSVLNYLNEIKKRTWIRTVVVPGINDDKAVMRKYAELTRGIDCIEKYELLPFHTLGFFKYEQSGIENKLLNTPPLDADTKADLQKYIDACRADRKKAE